MNRTTAVLSVPQIGNPGDPAGRVLLVCGDATERRRLEGVLRGAGLEVVAAGDGASAVGIALQECFDAILLDTALPLIDGASVIDLLEAVGYEDPVVALTVGGVCDTGVDDGYAAGIPRDADGAALLRCVTRVLPAALDAASGEGSAWHDTDDFRELVADYVGELPETAARLRNARASGDLEGVAGIAHRIKGTAGNLRLDGLSAAAAKLQQAARGAGSMDEATLRSALVDLDRELVALGVGGLMEKEGGES